MKKLRLLLQSPPCALLLLLLILLSLFTARPASAAPADLDTTFSGDGRVITSFGLIDAPRDMLVQPDGKIVVVGIGMTPPAATKIVIARYTAAGALDATFGTGGRTITTVPVGNLSATGVARQADGKLVVCGQSDTSGDDFLVLRYTVAGVLDTTFGGGDGMVTTDFGADSEATAVAVAPVSGKIIVVGTKGLGNGQDMAVACYDSTGALDVTFNGTGKLTVDVGSLENGAEDVAVLADGSILVAGTSQMGGTDHDITLAKITPLGVLDTSFDTDGIALTHISGADRGLSLCVQQDGDILVAGRSGNIAAVVRYDGATGALDTGFSGDGKLTKTVSGVTAVTSCDAVGVGVEPGGRIVVAAYSRYNGGANVLGATFRFEPDGTVDSTFGTSGTVVETLGLATSTFYGFQPVAMAVQGSGRIVVAGAAEDANEDDQFAVVRYVGDPLADLAVELPALTVLEDGVSTVDYWALLPTSTITKTFTLRNAGVVALNLDNPPVTVSGPGALSFLVTQPASTPLAPGATRTFTVKLGPDFPGSKEAVLHVGSSDVDEDTYDIALKAEVSPAVSFNTPAYAVVEGTPMTIKVNRAGMGGTVTVDVKSTGGTAAAGTHYTAVNETKTFLDASFEEDVILTTLDNGPGDATKTVILTLSGGTAPKGAPATLTTTVRILDKNSVAGEGSLSDTLPPPTAPSVSMPANAALVRVVTGIPVTITGTATDNRAVKDVEVSLDDFATFTPATLAAPGAASTAYTATVIPVGGSVNQPFTLRVRTRDYANLVTTSPASPARTFRVLRPVGVLAAAGGSVPASLTADPFFQPGTSVTITATPAAGKIFDRWIVGGISNASLGGVPFNSPGGFAALGITDSARELPKITFTMQEGLTLQATFLDNPFTAVAGTYNGLVRTDAVNTITGGGFTAPGNHTEGFITVTLQPTGAFSGTMSIDGLDLKVAGVFDGDMDARFGTTRAKTVSVLRTGKPALVVALHLALGGSNLGDEGITGTVVQNYRSVITARSQVLAYRKYYTGTAPLRMPVEFLSNPTTFADGRVTAYFQMQDFASQPAALIGEQYYPQGHGYVSMTVSKAGLCTYSGRLADDTVISGSTTATQDAGPVKAPLHIPLYGKQGCFIALLDLDPVTAEVVNVGDALWFRPYQDVQHYPDGWVEGLHLDVKGAVYQAPVTGQSVLDNTTAAARTGTVDFSGGLVPVTITKAFTATNADVVTDVDAIFSTTIARTTGVITGNFSHTDGTTTTTQPYYGVIYQKGTLPGPRGFGYFMSPTPVVKTYIGESGIMELKLD